MTLLIDNFRPVINSRLYRNLKDFLMAFFAMIAIGVGSINHSPLLLFLMNTCFWLHTSLEIRWVTYEYCLMLAKVYPWLNLYFVAWSVLVLVQPTAWGISWQGLGRELQGNPHGRMPWDACDSQTAPNSSDVHGKSPAAHWVSLVPCPWNI